MAGGNRTTNPNKVPALRRVAQLSEPSVQKVISSMGPNPEQINVQKELRPKYFRALTMYLVSGFSKRRIAIDLGMSRNTIVRWSRVAKWDQLRDKRMQNVPPVDSDGPVSSIQQVEQRYGFSLISHMNLIEGLLAERVSAKDHTTAEIATLVRLDLDLMDRARIFAGVDPSRGKETNPDQPIPVKFIDAPVSQPEKQTTP